MQLLKTALLLFVLALGAGGCQTNPSKPVNSAATVQPGYTPALDSDEAGLWLTMNRSEQDLVTSGSLINEAKINDYLVQIMCRLAPDLCDDVRVYLVRIPHFNATMAPNGVMQVWSGLLLRTENEAQLAYIMGHEIAHYRYQHSLQMFRQAKNTTNILAPFHLVTGAAGVGYVGAVGDLIAAGSLSKFSRDHEREADDGGFEMVAAAGYDPREAAKVWQGLLRERDALDADEPTVFFSTHPSSSERIANLESRATAIAASRDDWFVGVGSYDEAVGPLRFELMQDELRLRRFAATEVVLERLSDSATPAAQIEFFRAEMYLARAQDGDREKAEQAYLACLAHRQPPTEAYRDLAMIYMKSGRGAEAVPLFESYLQKTPDAYDRSMVKAYIRRIQNKEING